MANYGIGGRYTPHTDYGVLSKSRGETSEFDLFRGDRILTFMTYVILCLYNKVMPTDDERVFLFLLESFLH